CFFFQAEDGIRDFHVTGVQTCALPISASKEPAKRGKAAAADGLSPKEKARRQLFTRMGVNPEAGWEARYEILPGKEKVVDELKRLAKDADTIYLATDLDREGEAIAWHLRESIGGDDSQIGRASRRGAV